MENCHEIKGYFSRVMKQPDAACVFDHLLVLLTLSLQVFSVAVQNVSVLWVYVDVLKEVLVHEGMVALWVVSGQF